MAFQHRIKKGVFQYVTFNIIGFSNSAIDFGGLNLFLWLWPTTNSALLLLYNSIAYSAAVSNSYFWNSRFTFKQHMKKGYRQKLLFVVQAGISFTVNNLAFILAIKGLSLFLSSIYIVDNGAKAISVICSSTTSFFLMKWLVFRER